MGLGSVDNTQRQAFKKEHGRDWKEEVTSRYKAERLIEDLEKGGLNSYIVRKIDHLRRYADSDSKLSLIGWENEKARR